MKKNRADKYRPAPAGQMDEAVRRATGAGRFTTGGGPKRRLRCSKCPRTWKFSFKLLYGPCPACKEGRLG